MSIGARATIDLYQDIGAAEVPAASAGPNLMPALAAAPLSQVGSTLAVLNAGKTALRDPAGGTDIPLAQPVQVDQTASRALNTTYSNTGIRAIQVMATVRCTITGVSGSATGQGKSDASATPTTAASGIVGIQIGLLNEDNMFQISFCVAPGMKYRIDSTSSNGNVALGRWFEVTY